MKAVATIILTLATLAFAAPNPHADADALAARQSCTYSCQCLDPRGNALVDMNNECCPGGNVREDRTTCNIPIFPLAVGYAACCQDDGRPVCQPSGSGCPTIPV
ncbi:uncharacterized protein B0H64DRAFT_472675 [Chaetomium fimeti]|uniref:Uncharacterized protein n=1 Tax=Chaetomium fimeti TaxID=1854472 RepID=A0AAE0HN24_9PEZI|nr:hypothetical protein B0H64DRAFT_472675 [Chaetomium fimeti]